MSVRLRSWPSRARFSASGCEERDGGARNSVREEVADGARGAKSGVSSIVTDGAMFVQLENPGLCMLLWRKFYCYVEILR
jgi:hypothetical protein